jgi:phenylacetic acid degradation protein PaaD
MRHMTETAREDLARRAVGAMYDADAASQGLGITIDEVGPGHATARMTVTAAMLNGHGIGHGGYVFLLADSAFAFACNSYNQNTVAQSCDIAFLAAVREGDVLVAEATERALSGRTGIYDVTVRRSTGDVVAEFRGRSRTIAGTLVPEPHSQTED